MRSLLLFLLLPYAYFNTSEGWNQGSRLAELHAIVNQGALSIDAYHEVTGDMALVNGHYYSEKAPAIALVALPSFALTVFAERALGIDPDRRGGWEFSQRIATVCSVATIAALGGVAFFRLLLQSMGPDHALMGTIALFLGTLAWPYATALFAHAGTMGFISIALALLLGDGEKRERRAATAGLCAGLAVLAFGLGPRAALRFGLAALPAVLLIMLNNYLVTGSPLIVGYGSNPQFHGEGPSDNFGHHLPTAESLHGILFSEYRGLFFWSPVLMLAVPGVVSLARTAPLIAACITGVFALQVMEAAGFHVWWGGNAIGARYLTPAIPFLGLAAAHGIHRFPRIGVAFTALSVALMLLVTAIDIAPFEGIRRPLMEIYLPRLEAQAFAPNLGTALGLPPLTSLNLLALLMLVIGWMVVRDRS